MLVNGHLHTAQSVRNLEWKSTFKLKSADARV